MKDKLTLAITSIGDLLLHNRISRSQEGKPIEGVRVCIPEYQRPYKWTARNAIQLLDDIIEARNDNKEVYRVGTLILHKTQRVGEDVYDIVDGQQRTMTFALLLHALYELEEGERPSIEFLKQNIANNKYTRRNIPTNLNAFRRRIVKASDGNDGKNYEHIRDMQTLREFVMSQCELIVVITDDISEAFQFFDSQNARGKALYPHDLLKAYHLREMTDVPAYETEEIVKRWESISQRKLADFFGEYLYRLKEWMNGNVSDELCEANIHKFKGVNRISRAPYARFYKGAYAYASQVNSLSIPGVLGIQEVSPFQLNAPIIAGKPFFEYTDHYYSLLHDIRHNDKFEGFYIKGNKIVEILDNRFNHGTGNLIARQLFDMALLLYVDRFSPATYPSRTEISLFEQFVRYAFVWAYSLRAQHYRLGWPSAQNYIMGKGGRVNALNIFKIISDSDTPTSLMSSLDELLVPLTWDRIRHSDENKSEYLQFFISYNFLPKK
jgi:hypothetical protein